MKKLLLIFVDLLAVLALSFLVASCGGGGGGGGGGSDETAPVTPVRNENSVLDIQAPTYRDINLSITNSPSGSIFDAGASVRFSAASGYESYRWYVDGVQQGTGNPFDFTVASPSASTSYRLMLLVTDADGNYYGDSSKSFTVRAAN